MLKKVIYRLLFFGIITSFFGCELKHYSKDATSELSEEALYRPYFHFTPQKNWMNDPNGMFYLNGKYHLFFQHYPDSNVWGPMHWGHAESSDMVKWEEKPIALYPDSLGYIFSGSAVVDYNNTSGFGVEGKTPIVAIFTHHDMEKEKAQQIDVETQSIAYSLDEGITWKKYEGNPVIENPNIRDFRDPKVFWHEATEKWIMVLAAHNLVMIYGSPNLKDWEYFSEFGLDVGNHDGVWECPDLFQLPIEGTDSFKYVMLVSNSRNEPNSGSATQYFVGDFDGKSFQMDTAFAQELEQKGNFWMDFGKDNYAGVTWHNTESKSGEKYLIGWMSNWEYATKVPTYAWRSSMTIARKLSLKPNDETYRLISEPVDAYQSYAKEKTSLAEMKIKKNKTLISEDILPSEIDFSFSEPKQGSTIFSLVAQNGNQIDFGYNADTNRFFIDRQASGITDFHPSFANKISTAPRLVSKKPIEGKVFIDKTSVEIFWDGGLTTMSEIFFTKQPIEKLTLSSSIEELTLHHFNHNKLNIK